MLKHRRLLIARAIALLVVIGLSVFIFLIRDQAEAFAAYGYPGIFIISFLANATVLLPAPGIAIVFAMGAVFPPLGVAIAAGAGAALGELSGYLAGFSGQAVVENVKIYHRIHLWMSTHSNYSYLGILFLAFIPNPFFDLAGIAAGGLKMRLMPFLFWTWIGKTMKMLVFAYAGANSIEWLLG